MAHVQAGDDSLFSLLINRPARHERLHDVPDSVGACVLHGIANGVGRYTGWPNAHPPKVQAEVQQVARAVAGADQPELDPIPQRTVCEDSKRSRSPTAALERLGVTHLSPAQNDRVIRRAQRQANRNRGPLARPRKPRKTAKEQEEEALAAVAHLDALLEEHRDGSFPVFPAPARRVRKNGKAKEAPLPSSSSTNTSPEASSSRVRVEDVHRPDFFAASPTSQSSASHV